MSPSLKRKFEKAAIGASWIALIAVAVVLIVLVLGLLGIVQDRTFGGLPIAAEKLLVVCVGVFLGAVILRSVLLSVIDRAEFDARVDRSTCPSCGYDMAGISMYSGCPECGWARPGDGGAA